MTRTSMFIALGVFSCGALLQAKPIPNLTEHFTNSASGWTFQGKNNLVYSGQSLGIQFTAKDPTQVASAYPAMGELIANNLASSGGFIGDYNSVHATALNFSVRRSGITLTQLSLESASNGRYWYYAFDIPAGTTTWAHVSIPLTYSTQWKCMPATDPVTGTPNAAEAFSQDLSAVSALLLYANRDTSIADAQTLLVDDIVLQGDWTELDATGVSKYWYQECNIRPAEQNGAYDSDHDGLSNLGEFLMGTDPTNATSTLRLRIGRDASGHSQVFWTHAKNGTTTLLSSTSLTSGATFSIYDGVSVQSGDSEDSAVVGTESSDTVFYRVQIEGK